LHGELQRIDAELGKKIHLFVLFIMFAAWNLNVTCQKKQDPRKADDSADHLELSGVCHQAKAACP